MKSRMKIVYQTIKVFVLFTGCTILFYYGILWLNEEYQDYHRYDEPNGAAIKVSGDGENSGDGNLLNRLILFYLNGE